MWSSTASGSTANSMLPTNGAHSSQNFVSGTGRVQTNTGSLGARNTALNNNIRTSSSFGSFGEPAFASNGVASSQGNAFSSASQNFNAEIPKQSPQEIRSGALQAVHSIANTNRG